ncbi:MAG TPA: helix-turn-helix domain-containing protein [Pseudonocardiaceae bacterium]|jgi:sugar diacid utilization regulator|nr:helix-turn-helix domain-containing protein [Pseudonocardiaceae bacterium]
MVSVRAVAAMTALRLTVRTGADLLDREVSRIYGTELPDPVRFLSGGELVLTGLLWLRTDADVPPFVAALAGRGVAGIVACDADTGVIPTALVDECRRREVPLLEANVDLSFADVIDLVGQALAAERGIRDQQRRLITALARGAVLAELLALAAAELDAPCWVLTPLGRTVATSGTELPPDRLPVLIGAFLRADGRPKWVRGPAGSATLLPLPDSGGVDLTRWFLVVGRAEPREEIVAELVNLIAIQRNREQENRRVADQVTGSVLRAVMAGTAGLAEITGTALAAGIDIRRPLRVLAATTPSAPPGRAMAVLAELIATIALSGRPGLLGVVDDQVYALLPAGRESDAELAERAGAALKLVEPGLTTSRVVVGISAVTTAAELRGAVQEARHARELGERQPGRTRVVAGAEVAVHQLLLATVPDELRRALRRRVLGRLFDYDAEHDGSLVETLTVFLDCSGSWARAAARLHVHVNTLRYRIGRIEELTGADLADFTQRVDVYLALHAET